MANCRAALVVVRTTTVLPRASSTRAPATGRSGHGEPARTGPGQPGEERTVPETVIPDPVVEPEPLPDPMLALVRSALGETPVAGAGAVPAGDVGEPETSGKGAVV